MADSDVKVVLEMYEAFHRGDLPAALTHFDPEVVGDFSVRVDSGTVHGREELAAITESWTGTFEGWHEEIDEIRDLGTRVLVVATQRGRGKGSGVEVEDRYAWLYEVEGGLITRMAGYADADAALEAAGAGENEG